SVGARRQTAKARREDVIAAAIPEFGAAGLEGTSVERIASRAGISQPYVFRLFGTKKALFLAAYESCSKRIIPAFTEAASEAEPAPGAVLEALGRAYVALLTDRDKLQLQLQAYAACGDPDVRAAVCRMYGAIYETVARLSGAEPETLRRFFATGMLL